VAGTGGEPIGRERPIAPSPHHVHAARRADPATAPPRLRRDAALKVEIRRVFEATFQVCGARKVRRQLAAKGSALPAARWRA
jgi:hypothetical protein